MNELTEEQLQAAVEKWKGNWRNFDSFAWHDAPDDRDDWCIVETHHRDSPIKDQSNGHYFHKQLNPLVDDTRDVLEFGASHWAVGHTDGWAVRVVDQEGRPTDAFRLLVRLLAELAERDILDQVDYDERFNDGKRENIEFYAHHCLPPNVYLKDELPDGWVDRVIAELDDHDPDWTDDHDPDGTPRPRETDLLDALQHLDLLEVESG